MNCLYQTKRISDLKEKMLSSKRYASIEQARIITRVYQENEKLSIPKKRALSLKAALEELEISVEDEELIVGNRTKGVRYGVVFPESGCSWINQEFETLPTRPQDQFLVKEEDIKEFREKIYPYWKGKSLEDAIKGTYGVEINEISKVVKINQKDHAQGHICPDSALWLKLGPQGLMEKAKEKLKGEEVTSSNELDEKMGITESQFQEDKSNLIFYYKLSTQDLENMGISKVESDSKNGFYIIKYDVKNAQIDIYNEKGFENQDKTYYTLNEIENLKI